MRLLVSFAFVALATLFGTAYAAELASAPDRVTPVLLGSHLPDAPLQTIDGQPTTLVKAVNGKPAVLVFYRGGWCPFCNLQLSNLRLIQKDLQSLGYQLIAISPDRPEELRKTLGHDELSYTLLSDSTAAAIKAFGIAYRVDAATLAKLTAFGIDLEKSSGESHHALPVPAVYIVDAEGILQFSYVHPDYRVRVPSDVVLAAARAISEQREKLHPANK
ncbi:MAG: peroxiredoxin-like family protein [Dokdonella sp.]